MWALASDVAERFRTETVDLDPEHVEVGDGAKDLEVTFGFGIEIEVEQDIDAWSRAIAEGLEMHAQIAQNPAVDVDLRRERHAEPGTPALGLAVVVSEDVGLQRGEFFLADFVSDRLDAIEIGDRRLVPVGVVDAPGGAMRPVDANAVADFAAEQFAAGHAEEFRFRVEQRVFDRSKRLRDHAAGSRAGRRKK